MSWQLVIDEFLAGPIPQVGPLLLLFGLSFFVFRIRGGWTSGLLLGLPLLIGFAALLSPPDILFQSTAYSSALIYILWGGMLAFGAARGFTPLAGAAAGAIIACCAMDTWYYDQLSLNMPALWMLDLGNRVILAASWAVERAVPGSGETVAQMLAPAGAWAAANAGVMVRATAGIIGTMLLALVGPRARKVRFSYWRLGRLELLIVLPLGILLWMYDRHGSPQIRQARMFYLAIPFALQGLSVAWYGATRLSRSRILPLMLGAVALAPGALVLYSIVGFVDYLVDLRGLDRRAYRQHLTPKSGLDSPDCPGSTTT
ncbi:MAG: hypothetical protein P9M14_03055 [Candidatus Alcyoniella australis]|nr:hypothetical protein [Candidatus Alcyoniella australis]